MLHRFGYSWALPMLVLLCTQAVKAPAQTSAGAGLTQLSQASSGGQTATTEARESNASEQAEQQPERDAQAIDVVTRCIVASGGAAPLEKLRASSVVSGTLQKVSPNGTDNTPRTFTWTLSKEEFRRDLTDGATTKTFVSGHGSPGTTRNDEHSTALNYHVARAALPFYLPGVVLLNELQNPHYTITFIGQTILDGQAAVHVHTSDDSDKVGKVVSPQEWFFDPITLLPLRVEYRLPSNENAARYDRGAFAFLAFTVEQSVAIPTQFAYYEEDQLVAAVLVDSVSIDPSLSTDRFDLPGTGGAK